MSAQYDGLFKIGSMLLFVLCLLLRRRCRPRGRELAAEPGLARGDATLLINGCSRTC